MADLGGYEGVRQASLPGLPDLPGWPIRWNGGGLCPTVPRTEADGGVSSHPAPAVRSLLPYRWLQPLHLCLRPCQAREAPGQAASLRRATRSLGSCSSGDGDRTTPSPEEGRVENLLFPFCSVRPVVKTSKKSSFLFLRVPRGRGWQCTRPVSTLPSPSPSPVGSRVRSEDATPSPAPCPTMEPGQCHHTLRPHFETHCLSSRAPVLHFAAPPWVRQWLPWSRLYGPGGLARAPRPSRWLLRTIRLGYAIQFARRPPSSGAFGSPQCWARMPLSCVQKSRSYWRRTR